MLAAVAKSFLRRSGFGGLVYSSTSFKIFNGSVSTITSGGFHFSAPICTLPRLSRWRLHAFNRYDNFEDYVNGNDNPKGIRAVVEIKSFEPRHEELGRFVIGEHNRRSLLKKNADSHGGDEDDCFDDVEEDGLEFRKINKMWSQMVAGRYTYMYLEASGASGIGGEDSSKIYKALVWTRPLHITTPRCLVLFSHVAEKNY